MIKSEVSSRDVLRIQKNEPKNEGQDKKNDKTRSTEDIKSSKTHGLNACHPSMFDLKPPKVAEETPKSLQRSPKRPPRDPQEDPKGAQETSKTLPRPSWKIKSRFFKNQWMFWLESRFLRFGGSSWRSKIDPKRPQERIKNSFEEHRTRRGEKKSKTDDKKIQY